MPKIPVPSKKQFRLRQRHFKDKAGRLYILPTQTDSMFIRSVSLDHVDSGNYERPLRKGLAFDPKAELRQLTSRVMMYVQLPPAVGSIATGVKRIQVQMPTPFDRAKSEEDTTLTIQDSRTGEFYEARVVKTAAELRKRRGVVYLEDVHKIET